MLPERYSLENFERALRDPEHFHEELRRVNRALNSRLYAGRYADAFDVMEEDWDNLIILDGCRYDIFKSVSTIEGDLSRIVSQGGHSFEFMEKTFSGHQFHDTVYITSNPWIEHFEDNIFFARRTTYDEENQSGERRRPEDVLELALETFEEYPDKRYIVHFMQPNNPYVGQRAEELRARLLEEESLALTELHPHRATDSSGEITELPHLRRAYKNGYISRDEMMGIYRENLEIALEHAEHVMEELGGKSAITADHGDMFGERLPPLYLREFSHWKYTYSKQLRNVPWLVTERGARREVVTEQPVENNRLQERDVEEHLRSMGYLS
ncbi:hypothetical protein SAMN05216226_11658 [Halovenus aranensis]|uniref:Sulfatase n=1 Tax=Halovenus aranensis TaxID=890420 RepID=A0A1G8YVL3_9EURY|nr:hypothetical protein [Halovenus aranensis]SDK06813.1 hypothetical protein SAMN05216226_11658 [Halovenus aranensis]